MDISFFKLYNKYLSESGYIEADKFKNTKISDILYKYFPCTENRLNSLANQELWLAQHETFNDPHEFEFMFIEEDKFEKAELIGAKWDILYNFYDESFFNVNLGQFTRNYKQTTKRGLLTTNKG